VAREVAVQTIAEHIIMRTFRLEPVCPTPGEASVAGAAASTSCGVWLGRVPHGVGYTGWN
jgi:hypothetical protein